MNIQSDYQEEPIKREFAAITLFASVIFTAACSQAPTPAPAPPDTREADTKAIRDIDDARRKAYDAKDVDKLAALYTDDAAMMTPGSPAANGKDAIRKAWTEFMADPAMSLKFKASRVEVAKSGDMGFAQGSYTLVITNPATKKPMNDKGSYVAVYMKQADGGWKAVSDIATSELPPMPPKK